MQNYRFEFLNKLKTALGDRVTICDEFDEIGRQNFYSVAVNLGKGWAGSYKGGYWGDCTITDDELELHFMYGDLYGEGAVEYEEMFGEGMVRLNYKGGTDANGLAYTGELDRKIEDYVYDASGGLLHCSGSEQGMQGHASEYDESYLSVDVGELEEVK